MRPTEDRRFAEEVLRGVCIYIYIYGLNRGYIGLYPLETTMWGLGVRVLLKPGDHFGSMVWSGFLFSECFGVNVPRGPYASQIPSDFAANYAVGF